MTDITLTRTIPAAPQAIYDAWHDVARPGGPWYGAARVIVDARVKGLFYHCVKHEGREWAHYGRFTVLDRPRLIVHTWLSEGTRGLESTVTFRLEPAGAATLVLFRHAGVPDDDFGRQHGLGWTWVLTCLNDRFVAPKPT